jgi:GNAT superfamily N-acetyltransferase
MRGMGVVPDARGLGIGARLREQVERWATDQGGVRIFLRIFLSTTPFLNAAIRLYERFGFRRTDEGPHDLSGTPLFTMKKNVRQKARDLEP